MELVHIDGVDAPSREYHTVTRCRRLPPGRRVHPSVMFAAQALVRNMERAGREKDIQRISRNIFEVAPELPGKSA